MWSAACASRSNWRRHGHVNDQPVNDLPYSPFAGEKNSGIGRFNEVWRFGIHH
jgi:hypothetical protein